MIVKKGKSAGASARMTIAGVVAAPEASRNS